MRKRTITALHRRGKRAGFSCNAETAWSWRSPTGLRRGELLACVGGRQLLDQRLHVRPEPCGQADASDRPPRGRGTRGAVRGDPLPGIRLRRVLSRGARDAARPVEADDLPASRSHGRNGLRHTALTDTAAAGVPAMFVQSKAGRRAIPPRDADGVPRCGRTRRGKGVRMLLAGTKSGTKSEGASPPRPQFCPISRLFATPRVGLEPTTLRLTAGCSAN